MGQSYNLSYSVDVKANISSIKSLTEQIQKGLENIKLPAGVSKSFSSNISTILNELKELDRISDKTTLGISDTKQADKSWEKINTALGKIKTNFKELGVNGVDAANAIEKLIPQSTITKFKELSDAIEKAEKSLKGDDNSQESKRLKNRQKELEIRKELALQAAKDAQLTEKEQKRLLKAETTIKKGSGLSKGILDFKDEGKTKKYLKDLQAITEARKKFTEANKKAKETGLQEDKDVLTEARNARDKLLKSFNDKYGTSLKGQGDSGKDVKSLESQITAYKQAVSELNTLQQKLDDFNSRNEEVSNIEKQISQIEQSLSKLGASKSSQILDELATSISKLTGKEISDLPKDFEGLKKVVADFKLNNIQEVADVLKEIEKNANAAGSENEELQKTLQRTNQDIFGYDQAQRDLENLSYQVREFFSITNTIQIFKRTVREAFDTVKELDAVMTETAVVTDFTVGDMWDKLPQYAKQASALGTSIKDLYSATTLYYQQGLNSEQAMSVGVETMKMARIANMEASDATQAMTAALRGFNMEINESSATRVNDVYSELAAITAADTNQIATAMTKTASIADSANMEFETTAALLAQIIETTQEAPETAGTAMKTIIARFTEVKKLFDEGMLSGEDEEGESIEINKIDAALKTVGISLKDFLRGEKGIDDIFLDLASKWDTLDLATQRYIATTAAGSRQQSRFIAMMSNYKRTMELVNAANNSAGASQNQYEKTLDSMEAKLQKLKNAWDVFVMNLANNDILKGGVDILTGILNTVNNLTEAFSGNNGLTKSLLSFLTLIGALKGGSMIFKKGMGYIGGALGIQQTAIPQTNTKWNPFRFQQIDETSLGYAPLSMLGGFINKAFPEDKEIEITQQELEEAKSGYQKVNMVSGILTSTGMLASLLSGYAEEQDMDKLATGLEHFGATAQFAGVGVNVLNQALALSGKSWGQFGTAIMGALPTLLPILLGIAAIAGLGYMAYQASPEGQLKAAGKKAEQATKYAEDTKKSYEELNQSLKSIEEQSKAIDKMVSGTEEWNTAVKQLNKDTAELLENNEGLVSSGAVSFQGGILKLEEAKVGAYQKEQEIKTIKAEGLEIEANKVVEQAKLNTINPVDYLGDSIRTSIYTPEIIGGQEVQGTSWYNTLALEELAKAIASGEVFDDDTAQEWVSKNYENGQAYIDEGDIPKLRDWGEALLASENKVKQYDMQMAQNIKTLAEANGGFSDFSKNLDDTFIADMYRKQFETKKSDLDSKELTQVDFNEYAALKGYTYEKVNLFGKGVFKDSEGKTIKVKAEDIKKDLATDRAQTEVAKNLNQIESQFTGEASKLASQLFSQDGADMLQESVSKFSGLIDENTGKIEYANRDKIAKLLGQTHGWDKFAEAMNTTPEALFELVTSNIDFAAKRIQNQRKDLIKSISQYGPEIYFEGEADKIKGNSYLLADLENKYGENFRNTLQDIFDSVSRSDNEALTENVYSQFIKTAIEGNEQQINELSDFINEVDWSNPIEATNSLNKELRHGTSASKDFAQNIIDANQSFLGLGSQIRYLVSGSQEFEEMSDSLDEIIEQNGEISSSDIYNLADQYKSLDKIMDNTGASAGALAEVLESVQVGDLGVHQITDAVMAAIGQIDGLASMIAGLNKDFSNFNPSIDENFASQFFAQAAEAINTNIEKGAYGNSQIDSYMDYLIGEDWDADITTNEQKKALVDKAGEFFTANSENLKSGWEQIVAAVEGTDTSGILNRGLRTGGKTVQEALGFNVESIDEEIVLSGYENLSIDQMTQNLSEVFGITQQMAKAFLTDYKGHSLDFNDWYYDKDAQRMAERAANAAGEIEGQKHLDQTEVDAIEKTTNVDITEELSKLGVAITNFYDESGMLKQGTEAWSEYQEISNKNLNDYVKEWKSDDNAIITRDAFDMSKLQDELKNSGLSEEVQAQISQGALKGYLEGIDNAADESGRASKAYEVNVRMSDGSQKQITVAAGQSLEEAYNQAEQEHYATNLAESFKEVFSSFEGEANISINDVGALVADSISSRSYSISVSVSDVTGLPNGGGGSTGANRAEGQKPHIGPSYASGTASAKRTHAALTGEEGPELIWRRSQHQFYLAGTHGPEMTTVHPTDTVYTAKETKKILNQPDGPKMPGFAKGLTGPSYSDPIRTSGYGDTTAGSGGKKTSSDSKKDKEWENPYDKLYNLLREINEELRERERIERRYEQLLESLEVSARKIIDISRKELEQLEVNRSLEQERIEARNDQIKKYQEENKDLNKYGWTETNERGETVLRIDWDLIDTIKDPEEGEKIEEYIGQLEEWFDDLETAQDSLEDIEDLIFEIKERGKEEYKELEETIKDAVVNIYEKEIEKLEEINSSINDTNAELLNSIQKSIDKQRQDRDNQKTEEELAEKQRRLLYLQQDTSGANALEIMRLQKEIEEGQEDYTDTLIDQKISELQEQNEEASKQRDQQITLLQSQLDHYIESGHVWDEVYSLMRDGLDESNGLVRGSRLEEILKNGEAFEGMSVIGQMEWWKDINNMIAQGLAYLEVGRQLEDIGVKENTEIEFTDDTGKVIKGKVDKNGNVVDDTGYIYDNVFQGADGNYYAGKNIKSQDELKPKPPKEEEPKEESKKDSTDSKSTKVSIYTADDGTKFYNWGQMQNYNKDIGEAKEKYDGSDMDKMEVLKNKAKDKYKQYMVYKTGGLADFTGPAWLDGTKARPELVLNQRDTQNFIKLKDILSSIMSRNFSNSSTATENNGDVTYDIDINVETLGNDYDVEQVAKKVKTMITDSARYRNNNTIGITR